MANLHHLGNKIEEIKALIGKLEKGTLSSSEVEDLVNISRELYERSVILQYKSFEEKVFGNAPQPVVEEKVEEPVVVAEEPTKEEEIAEEQEEEKEEEPAFDFSLFDTPNESTDEPEIEEHISLSHTEKEEDGIHQETVEMVHTKIESTHVSSGSASAFEKIMMEAHSESGLNMPLDTLVGAFGLNERLQFINELFGGSSENFAEGVRVLDALSTKSEAGEKVAQMAATYNWDKDSEVVADFLAKVSRRYA